MSRRVALVCEASNYVGPDLARTLARRDHDLVLGNPADGLVDELEAIGAQVATVSGLEDFADPTAAPSLVEAAMERFGRIDSAVVYSGRIVVGPFMQATVDDLHAVVAGNLEAPMRFLQAVLPPMIDAGNGQVLVITSASGARPTPGAPLYSATRAGANMLVRNVADEIASSGVQVNAVGTNFMDFPAFRKASRIEGDPERRARIEAQVPMGRLGTMEEFAAFCAVFLDGTSGFQTGAFVPYAGGWA
ncbi:MAG: SDR family oxidoreductase [Actinomycetota bacterium]